MPRCGKEKKVIIKKKSISSEIFCRLSEFLNDEDLNTLRAGDLDLPKQEGREPIIMRKGHGWYYKTPFCKLMSCSPSYDVDDELQFDVTIEIPDQVLTSSMIIGDTPDNVIGGGVIWSVNADDFILMINAILRGRDPGKYITWLRRKQEEADAELGTRN